jgi:hypothetical protein
LRLLRSIICTGVVAAFGLCGASLPAEEKKDTPKMLKEGDTAPDFKLQATQIEKVLPNTKDAKTMSLKDFQGANGKNVVLFFFPKALTGG